MVSLYLPPFPNSVNFGFTIVKGLILFSCNSPEQETLLDLLGVAGQLPGLPVVVCCSSRDELDSVCSHVTSLPFISLSSLVLLRPSRYRLHFLFAISSLLVLMLSFFIHLLYSVIPFSNSLPGQLSYVTLIASSLLPKVPYFLLIPYFSLLIYIPFRHIFYVLQSQSYQFGEFANGCRKP